MFGIDYSFGGASTKAMKQAGVEFACRYVSTPGNSKNLTRGEAARLRAAGIDIVTVFETSAKRALSGFVAGNLDAQAARLQAARCGAPADVVIYFAVDFDATPGQQAAINQYLRGAAKVLGSDRVGVYGSYYVVKRALRAGVCKYGWQTYAWSGGNVFKLKATARLLVGAAVHRGAHLYQYKNGQRLAGMNVDFNRSLADDFGQWGRATPKPPPPPKPTPKPTPQPAPDPATPGLPADFWLWVSWRMGVAQFAGCGKENPAVNPVAHRAIPARWERAWSQLEAART